MSKKNPLLIELVGYPGCGKTSVGRNLIQRFIKAGLNTQAEDEDVTRQDQEDVSVRILRRFENFFQCPWLTARMYKFVLSTEIGPLSALRAAGRLSNLAVRVANAGERNCEVLISDELFVHGLFSFWFGRVEQPKEKQLESIIKTVYAGRDHLLVYLDIPRYVCQDRFSRRDGTLSRFNSQTNGEMVDGFLNDLNYAKILRCYERATGRSFVKVDALKSITDVTEVVFELVCGAICYEILAR